MSRLRKLGSRNRSRFFSRSLSGFKISKSRKPKMHIKIYPRTLMPKGNLSSPSGTLAQAKNSRMKSRVKPTFKTLSTSYLLAVKTTQSRHQELQSNNRVDQPIIANSATTCTNHLTIRSHPRNLRILILRLKLRVIGPRVRRTWWRSIRLLKPARPIQAEPAPFSSLIAPKFWPRYWVTKYAWSTGKAGPWFAWTAKRMSVIRVLFLDRTKVMTSDRKMKYSMTSNLG